MIHWRAVICHALLLSTTPLYYTVQSFRHPDHVKRLSSVWCAIAAFVWIYWLTQITIPVLTSPALRLPSGPGDRIPFGHFSLRRQRLDTDHVYNIVSKTPNNGVIVFWDVLYMHARYLLTTPEANMDLLNTRSYDWIKPKAVKNLLTRVIGNGLIIVEGNEHRAMRKSVAPAFSGRHIRDLVPLFWSKGLAFADAMARDVKLSADSTVEVMGQMSRVTLDVIGSAGIGVDFDTINNEDNELAQLYETITGTNRGPLALFFLIMVYVPNWLIVRMRGTVYSRVAIATKQLRQKIRALLAEKERAVREKTVEKDIIAIIMRSGEFSDDYLCDQLLTFLAAGHDTTASALTWTTWLLAQHPEIQDRLRKECQQHLCHKSLDEVDAGLFDNMPYLTAVCNETLRLYPAVPATSREAIVNTTIADVPISKGQVAIVIPWVVNRLPSFWGKDSLEYNPDRWLSGPNASNGGANSPYVFNTFLHGPRSCIGQSFARVEMRCLLAALIMRFQFEIPENSPEVVIAGFVTIKPQGGLRLRLRDLADKS